jgi:hypothetical protein
MKDLMSDWKTEWINECINEGMVDFDQFTRYEWVEEWTCGLMGDMWGNFV